MGFADQVNPDHKAQIWCLPTPNGACVQKMTMGMAILYAPFFGVAHVAAPVLGYEANGYSKIYHFMMAMCALFYAVLGLFLLRKLLLRYFVDQVVAITLPIIYLGTNLFFYITSEGGMAHNANVFLIVCFLWAVVRREETHTWYWALLIGLTDGMLVLIRPTNIWIFGIFLLYGVRSWADIKMRTALLVPSLKTWLLIGVGALFVISPQLLYWKTVTGDWIYYSYGDEGFFFGDPAWLNSLFSFRKGWLLYTPVMVLALVGFLWGRRYFPSFQVGFIGYFVLFCYVTFSWWCWWYGGSYGNRAMIDSYAVLAFPLAVTIDRMWRSRKRWRWIGPVIALLFIGFNQFQTFQYRRGILHYDSMTREAYVGIFGKIHYPAGYDEMVQSPDYEGAKKGEGR